MDDFSYIFSLTGTPDAPSFVPAEAWLNIVNPDILKQCDAIDGVEDGIIEDPNLCNYTPSLGIICSGDSNSTSCITPEQADTVRRVFSPFFIGDELIFPRLVPGSEIAEALSVLLAGDVATFSTVSSIFQLFQPLVPYPKAPHSKLYRIGSNSLSIVTPASTSKPSDHLTGKNVSPKIPSTSPPSKETSLHSKTGEANSFRTTAKPIPSYLLKVQRCTMTTYRVL
jgi:hypothetical protein